MKSIFLESHNIKNLNFGFGQFNYHLIKGLSNEIPGDLRLTLHAKNTQKLKEEFGDKFNYKKYYSFRRHKILSIRKKYDLWHCMNQNIKIEPYHNIPYLLTVHNTSYIKNIEDYKEKKEHLAFQEKLNRSTAIVYISNYAKDSTHKFFSVPKVKEYVIYNGNPVSKILLNDSYKPKFTPSGKYLFTIGEVKERKNFKSLVNLLRIATDYQLIIAGKKDTKAANEIEQLIERYGLKNRIHLVGKISEIDKQYYYNNCEAFVFPSLREGFGLPVIEAMKFGKPVFISNNTSLPEIGGEFAFYWDNYDAEYMSAVLHNGMQTYLNDKENYSQILKKRADAFNWSDSAKAYIEVYKSLVNL